MSTGAALRAGGWDPVLLVSQMVLLQTVHYLALSILAPFAAGGAPAVALVMDWRELAGVAAGGADGLGGGGGGGGGAYAGGQLLGPAVYIHGAAGSDARGAHAAALAACWAGAVVADVWALYVFVRRPRMVLDFALSLAGAHVVLATYYAGALPRGLVPWATYAASCAATVVLGEQACVRREMAEGIRVHDLELGPVD